MSSLGMPLLEEGTNTSLATLGGESMKLMSWNDGLSVGNDHMDSQHKDIIHLMNMLLKHQGENTSASHNELPDLLSNLRIVLARHFIEEEYLLEQTDCPWFEEHAVDHAYIVSKLSETDEMEAKEIIGQRIPLLQNLLETHFAVQDVDCRDYLAA
jgi:hemerythrin